MKYLAQILLLGCVLLVFRIPVFAVSVSVSNAPSSIDKDQEFEIDAFLSCLGCSSDSYLRAAFYPSGTSYFGYTQNNDGTWINEPGGNCTQYYKIVPSDLIVGSWSGTLKVKPDSASSYYTSPGEYLFKVGRYTASCSSPTWSQEFTIAITGPTPTPTPAPTQSFTPTPSSTIMHTSTPTKTPTPTKLNSPTLTPSVTEDAPLNDLPKEELTAMVLGVAESSASGRPLLPFAVAAALIGLGLALIAGVLVWQKRNAILKQ